MVIFKHFEIKLLKVGKVLKHITKVAGNTYSRAKMYLNNGSHIYKSYELYDIGKVEIEEVFSKTEGEGILIFFPKRPRKKEEIGQGTL